MTLTSNTERTSSMPRFQLRSVLPAIPALLTRIEIGPSAASVRLTAAATWLSEQTSPPIARPSRSAATASARALILVEDRYPGSRQVQPAGDSRSDALTCAGHERRLAAQVKESHHETCTSRLGEHGSRDRRRAGENLSGLQADRYTEHAWAISRSNIDPLGGLEGTATLLARPMRPECQLATMTDHDQPLLVLTNDDGIDAPGMQALLQAADGLGQCRVIAPSGPLSGCGHQVTTHQPIPIARDRRGHLAIGGTPADCIRLAIYLAGNRGPLGDLGHQRRGKPWDGRPHFRHGGGCARGGHPRSTGHCRVTLHRERKSNRLAAGGNLDRQGAAVG